MHCNAHMQKGFLSYNNYSHYNDKQLMYLIHPLPVPPPPHLTHTHDMRCWQSGYIHSVYKMAE